MKGGCDYSALAKVDAQLQELLNGRLDAIIDEKSSEAAAALLSKLKKRTPVGKAPHFDEPMTVTIKGDDYTTQTVNKKGEQVFRKRKGKTYRFRSKSGSMNAHIITTRTVSAATIARTAMLALALINQILSALGKPVLPIESAQLEQLISTGFTTVSALVNWWFNNSFTLAALAGDEEYERRKNQVH